MKAMILAAGLGTRLRPLTDRIPKALVEINGTPIIELLIGKLKSQGFDYIVVNVHHFSEKLTEFLRSRDFGVKIKVSDESDRLLDTGGGIVKALPLLFPGEDSPVLVHNVDILSNADLPELIDKEARESRLLVSERDSSRKLLFHPHEMVLSGWKNISTGELRVVGKGNQEENLEYAFSGIYSLTREAVSEMKCLEGEGSFPIMDYFLDPRRKARVTGVLEPDLQVLDIGKPATLSQASRFIV